MSGEPSEREDHLVEPLFDALRGHEPDQEPKPRERKRSRFLFAALIVAALLLWAWLA